MHVVDLLEVVKVEKQCCDARSVTTRTPDLVQQKLPQITGVVKLGEIVCLRESFSFGDANCVRECRSDGKRERVEQGDVGFLESVRSVAFANALDDAENAFTADQGNGNDELAAFLSLDRSHAGRSAFGSFRFRTERKLRFSIQQASPVFFSPVFLACFSDCDCLER